MNSVDRIADRLRALADEFAIEPETLEHFIDQAVVWLAWYVLHADPNRPFFHRQNDLVSQWGGPNADNVYRHARIDPSKRYVIRGRMHSCEEFILAIRAGFMHNEVWGTLTTLTASDIGVGAGDDFEIHLGGDAPGAVELPDGALMVSIREYYFEWQAEEPAFFTIECLDPEPQPPIDGATLDARLDAAMAGMHDSLRYWVDYMADNRAERIDNSFSTKTVALPTKGLTAARYEFCFWDLAPDQALIIETTEPAARYWAAQLYMMRTFELVDQYGAITSRNHLQTEASTDGVYRFVLAASDPGVPNWLDTTGRRNGLCTIRWFWPTGDGRPEMSARVVPLSHVRNSLPADTPSVSPEARAAELAQRQAHLRARFRA